MQQIPDEEIVKEMRKSGVPVQYESEGLDIIRNYIERNANSTLEEAVFFLLKWIKRIE